MPTRRDRRGRFTHGKVTPPTAGASDVTRNADTKQPIKERYMVYNAAGSPLGAFDNLTDAQHRASLNAGARVVNASSYTEPSLWQRLRDARPDDADRKATAKAAKRQPVTTWYHVFDDKGNIVQIYSQDEKDKATSHAQYLGGTLRTKINDPNKSLWKRLFAGDGYEKDNSPRR